jgi:hypothetical protein
LTTKYRAADGHGSDNGIRLSQVLAGLSYALDLTEGQRPGHSIRSCLIGMRIAEVIMRTTAQMECGACPLGEPDGRRRAMRRNQT